MGKVAKVETDKLADAKRQGQAQFDSIKEMVSELRGVQGALEDTGSDALLDAEDAARERIQENALSVQVRSGWHSVVDIQGAKAAEYEILLCTGGPACRIIGELNEHFEPETATMEVQDWFQPWTEIRPSTGFARGDGDSAGKIMLDYARCFYFGEG